MQVDGDLWELFWRTIRERSPYSIQISKVKGHATDQQVAEGKVRRTDKIGNDKADEAADEGVEQFTMPTLRLSKLYVKRHIAYSSFVSTLHEHLVFLYNSVVHVCDSFMKSDHYIDVQTI